MDWLKRYLVIPAAIVALSASWVYRRFSEPDDAGVSRQIVQSTVSDPVYKEIQILKERVESEGVSEMEFKEVCQIIILDGYNRTEL